jgi:8-oxo-dGTP diphosphatase
MRNYVLGFMFDAAGKKVALIQKKRPAWQAGLLNGIGGKVEPGETDLRVSMSREFCEETGVDVGPTQWKWFGRIDSPQAMVQLYYCRDTALLHLAVTTTDEEVHILSVDTLSAYITVPNLMALIYAALDPQQPSIRLTYTDVDETECPSLIGEAA